MHPREFEKLQEGSAKPCSPELSERRAIGVPAPPPPSHAPPGRYLRAPAAAAYLGLSASTLAKMRLRGDGPLFSKAGAKIVVYDITDLDAYLAARRRRSTSDTGKEAADAA